MSRRVELVFRTVGERTSDLALALAKKHIRPDKVHVIENVAPFREAVAQMLRIQHDCDTVVHMDADCLILEDMRPFLDWNEHPYVDCYVSDRFRGRIHCGVHITRADVVAKMATITPPKDDLAYVLRPESRLRNLALKPLKQPKKFYGFRILHDHYQWFHSIWEKYALRELRSRTTKQSKRLAGAMSGWDQSPDMRVARDAIAYTREHVPHGASTAEIDAFIGRLPSLARDRTGAMDLPSQGPLREAEIEPPPPPRKPTNRVFGLGLSRTGTRSLTAALHVLGFHTVHYPIDEGTLRDLERGDGRFHLLDFYHGLTDITVSPYYAQLDAQYPGSKFILTVRDPEKWLRSAKNHWEGRPAWDDPKKSALHMKIRRLLRASTYGCYDFEPARFRYVYEQHVRNVRAYFADRPDDLLELPLTDGVGWSPLCDFLGVPEPKEPFPHKGGKLSAKLAGLEVGD